MPDVSGRNDPYDWHRISSALLAIGWLTVCGLFGGVGAVFEQALAVALPLACVWFPDELGSFTTTWPGPLGMTPITQASPGGLVRALGWVLLVIVTFGQLLIVLAWS